MSKGDLFHKSFKMVRWQASHQVHPNKTCEWPEELLPWSPCNFEGCGVGRWWCYLRETNAGGKQSLKMNSLNNKTRQAFLLPQNESGCTVLFLSSPLLLNISLNLWDSNHVLTKHLQQATCRSTASPLPLPLPSSLYPSPPLSPPPLSPSTPSLSPPLTTLSPPPPSLWTKTLGNNLKNLTCHLKSFPLQLLCFGKKSKTLRYNLYNLNCESKHFYFGTYTMVSDSYLT